MKKEPDTERNFKRALDIGEAAAAAYLDAAGMSGAAFKTRWDYPMTSEMTAENVLDLVVDNSPHVFSGSGRTAT